MTVETDVLAELIKVDALYKESDIVKGITQKAVDIGFDKLSVKQQGVINHLLSKDCDGVTNPGGYHNSCRVILEGQELIDATINSGYYGEWLCEDCRNESDGYDIEREKFMAD